MIDSMTAPRIDAVVLAGGTAERLGGVSKADLLLSRKRLLDLVLESIRELRKARAGCDIVVAPASVEVPGVVLRTMENPPGSGPLAGIDAGLGLLSQAFPATSSGPDDSLVLVSAVDSPGIGAWAPALLDALAPGGDSDGAIALGGAPEPFRQYLQGIYRRRALSRVLSAAGNLGNRSVRGVLHRLSLIEVPIDFDSCRDLDTPEDLAWWRERVSGNVTTR